MTCSNLPFFVLLCFADKTTKEVQPNCSGETWSAGLRIANLGSSLQAVKKQVDSVVRNLKYLLKTVTERRRAQVRMIDLVPRWWGQLDFVKDQRGVPQIHFPMFIGGGTNLLGFIGSFRSARHWHWQICPNWNTCPSSFNEVGYKIETEVRNRSLRLCVLWQDAKHVDVALVLRLRTLRCSLGYTADSVQESQVSLNPA